MLRSRLFVGYGGKLGVRGLDREDLLGVSVFGMPIVSQKIEGTLIDFAGYNQPRS